MKKLISVLLSLAIMAGLCAAMPLSAAAEDRDVAALKNGLKNRVGILNILRNAVFCL